MTGGVSQMTEDAWSEHTHHATELKQTILGVLKLGGIVNTLVHELLECGPG